MPTNLTPEAKVQLEQEGRLLLAISAFNKGTCCQLPLLRAPSVYRAQRFGIESMYAHPRWMHVATAVNSQVVKRSRLRNALSPWIDVGDPPAFSCKGNWPILCLLQLVSRNSLGTDGPLSVGHNWVTKFVKRHPELQIRYIRNSKHKRPKCKACPMPRLGT